MTEPAVNPTPAMSPNTDTPPAAAPAAPPLESLAAHFQPGPDGKVPEHYEFRDARGKFTLGNPGGAGNPYARQTAAFRRKFQSCVKEEDIEKAYEALAKAAHTGNVPALRLFFEYVTGKPVKAEDPDRVDAHEWQVAKETVITGEELAQVMNAPTMPANLKMTRMFRPLLTSAGTSRIANIFANPAAHAPEVPDISILDRPAPKANGPVGAELAANMAAAAAAVDALAGGKAPPSPDGPNGGPGNANGKADRLPSVADAASVGVSGHATPTLAASATGRPQSPSANGPIGNEEADNLSVLAKARPSPNGKKRHEPALRR